MGALSVARSFPHTRRLSGCAAQTPQIMKIVIRPAFRIHFPMDHPFETTGCGPRHALSAAVWLTCWFRAISGCWLALKIVVR
jgi:hypothetical protein